MSGYLWCVDSRAKRKSFVMRVLLAVILLLAGSVASVAQTNSAKPQLVIKADMLSQQYCANNPNMTTLRLRLRLRYTNAGVQKLILYRGDDLFYQARIRAARAEAGARPYEIAVLNARYLEVEDEPVEQPAPNKLFVILQPGASFEAETTVGVGVVPRSAARDRHAIFEGEHTLQLIVSTWYRTPALAEKLRERWQRKGFLWSNPVASDPITFRAVRPPSPPPCK
jgi:hypothetical protein